MSEYRVTYINENGRRAHRDYKTLSGAMRFVDYVGRDDCIIARYDYRTYCFEPVPCEELEAKQQAIR